MRFRPTEPVSTALLEISPELAEMSHRAVEL